MESLTLDGLLEMAYFSVLLRSSTARLRHLGCHSTCVFIFWVANAFISSDYRWETVSIPENTTVLQSERVLLKPYGKSPSAVQRTSMTGKANPRCSPAVRMDCTCGYCSGQPTAASVYKCVKLKCMQQVGDLDYPTSVSLHDNDIG